MKAFKLMSIMVLLLLAVLSVSASLDVTDVHLGGDSQERGQHVTTTVQITNNDNSTITDLTFDFLNDNSKYQLNATLSDTELDPGESATLTVAGYVPLDLDAVNSDGKKISVNIGSLKVEGTEGSTTVTKVTNVDMEAESKLTFYKSRIAYDTKDKSMHDGDSFSNLKRDMDVKFTVGVDNKFDRDGTCDVDGQDCDIEDIYVNVDSDSDLDFEDDIDFGTLRSDRDDSDSLSFTIPDDIDDGNYYVEFYLTGTDENGALQGDYMKVRLEVDVPRDEVSIKNLDLYPDTVSCNDKTATLSVTLENSGRDDQDEASIFVSSAKLDLKDSIYHIQLDEGDTTTKTFVIPIPADLAEGMYFIQVSSNVNTNDETDRDSATLYVEKCTPEQPPVEDNGSDTTNGDDGTIKVIEVPPTGNVIYGTEKESSFFDSTEYLVLLGALFIIALLLLFILIVVLLRK